jgi:AraC-like DNA-binding protein
MQDGTSFFSLDGPLSAAPADHQTRAVHLQGFPSLVRGLGREPNRILERYEIDPTSLGNPECYVDRLSLLNMIEYCSEALDEPLFGFHLARLQATHPLGSIVPLCKAAPDLRSALTAACTFLPVVHCPQCHLELVEGERIGELRFGARPGSYGLQQMLYGSMFTLSAFLRELCDGAFAPAHISATFYPASREITTLQSALACRIFPRARENAIAFPSELLRRPLRSADRVIFRLLGDYLAKLRIERQHSLVQRVESYIRGALSLGPTLDRCATALGYSSRALQIKLEEYGATFTDLLSKHRIGLAHAYLASGELSLNEIALRLGYSDQTSFGRAFRRWTGFTPGDYLRGRRGTES